MKCEIAKYSFMWEIIGVDSKPVTGLPVLNHTPGFVGSYDSPALGFEDSMNETQRTDRLFMLLYRDLNHPDCDLYCGKNKIIGDQGRL